MPMAIRSSNDLTTDENEDETGKHVRWPAMEAALKPTGGLRRWEHHSRRLRQAEQIQDSLIRDPERGGNLFERA